MHYDDMHLAQVSHWYRLSEIYYIFATLHQSLLHKA